jgi:hypothetical protein
MTSGVDISRGRLFVVKTRERITIIDLSYRPRLTDLRLLTRSNSGLLPFEPERIIIPDAGAFRGRAGYDEDFLTEFGVPLPGTTAIADDVLLVSQSDGTRTTRERDYSRSFTLTSRKFSIEEYAVNQVLV